jgi:hypothetical protein
MAFPQFTRRKIVALAGGSSMLTTLAREPLAFAEGNFADPTRDNGPSDTGNQSATREPLYPRTGAEISAKVTPALQQYEEGDIRRYGATTSSSDNSASINAALLVAQNGGAAAYIPPGRWTISNTLTLAGNASMHGAGGSSVLYANGCNAVTYGPGAFYSPNSTTGGMQRFLRDLQIVGSNHSNSTFNGITINFSADSGIRVAGIHFQNLFITNFKTGIFLRGSWNNHFTNVFGWNNFYGMYFIGQNVRNVVLGGGWVTFSTGMTGPGQSYGISFHTTAGESTQSTQLISAYVFGYSIGINAVLALELQIESCDISSNQSTGISITTIIGGCWVTNCWIECQNSSATTGVIVVATGVNNHQDIRITGNHITNDNPFAGSIGVSVNYNHPNVIVSDNRIEYFDVGVKNSASDFVCKNNSIAICTPVYGKASVAISQNSVAANCEIGPNYIQPGAPQTATMKMGSSSITVPDSKLFPVGQPVQFDATANGFMDTVTYFVVASEANAITVAGAPGDSALSATGSSAVNVFQCPLPITFNAGTSSGLMFYGKGAFLMALSGFATGVIAPVNWSANGHSVAISMPGVSGPSNATTMVGTNIPAAIAPAKPQFTFASVVDNGTGSISYTRIATASWTFSVGHGGPFSASGTKGTNAISFSYPYG